MREILLFQPRRAGKTRAAALAWDRGAEPDRTALIMCKRLPGGGVELVAARIVEGEPCSR